MPKHLMLVGGLASLLALSLLIGCTEGTTTDPTLGHSAAVSLHPTFPASEGASSDPAAQVDRLHARFTSTLGGPPQDALILWPVDQDRLEFSVTLKLWAATESFTYRLQGHAGDTPLFEATGEITVTARQNASPVAAPTFRYVGPGAEAVSISIGGAPDNAVPGETFHLSATVRAGDETVIAGAPIVWTSLDPLAADVDQDGLVTIARQAGGTASISARVAYTDVSDVVILPVRGLLRINPPEVILRSILESAQLVAEIFDSDGQAVPGPHITWTSLNPAVGQVDAQEGNAVRVVAIAPGQAGIVASAGDGWADTAMVVVAPAVASVAVSPDSVLLNVGDTIDLGVTAADANGHPVAGAVFSWTSSDNAIAAVDNDGVVRATGPGTATITATSGGQVGAALVMVAAAPLASVTVAPDSAHFTAFGDTLRLGATARDTNGAPLAGVPLVWAALDTLVATVDGAGLVTARGNGLTHVVVSANGAADTALVTVSQTVAAVAVSPDSVALAVGDSLQLEAVATDANGHAVAGAAFAWAASADSVATVGATGLVSAVGPGTATITATSGGHVGAAVVVSEGGVPQAGGVVVAWGSNDRGQVANAPEETDFMAIAAGLWHGVALRSDGSLVSWGSNSDGQVSGTPAGNDFVAIAAGGAHSVAVRTDGSLVSWGDNFDGQVSGTPAGNDFVAVAAGAAYSVALRSDGSLVSWGSNSWSQVSNTPAGTGFVAIAARSFHTVALRSDGSVVAWGMDQSGSVTGTPTDTVFVAIAAGTEYSVAVRSDGSLVAWGGNAYGQADTPAGADYVAVAAGYSFSVAIRADGSLVAWGDDAAGQVGSAPTTGSYSTVSVGSQFAIALTGPPPGSESRVSEVSITPVW